jgi:hypothetical protein
MFKLAVLGPLVNAGIGVGQRCAACYRAREADSNFSCSGFGPGCLAFKAKAGDTPTEEPFCESGVTSKAP